MSIGAGGRCGAGNGVKALGHKVEDRYDLLPRNVELFNHFLEAQVLQILDDSGHRQACTAKHPCATTLPGMLSTAGHCDQSRLAIGLIPKLSLYPMA